jgi:DNA adenine methylase
MKQFPRLRGVKFFCCSYDELDIPDGSLIYCDPPYEGTTGYTNPFDHTKFWEWVRVKSEINDVFVSEYSAPDDFEVLWEREISSFVRRNDNSTRHERLFRLKSKKEVDW